MAVRLAWKVPYRTHRYLIEGISGCLHPKVMLASRHVKFMEQLKSSSKMGVRVLASLATTDLRTVMGRTAAGLAQECGSKIEDVTPSLVKRKMKYFDIPDNEKWRLGVIQELVAENLFIPGFTDDEASDILETLCTS